MTDQTDHLLTAITAWAAVAAALAAAISVVVSWRGIREQNHGAEASRKDFKLSLSADLSMKLEDRFDTSEQRKVRSRAAQALLSQSNMIAAEDVFDFFEMVGLLVRSDALTKVLAYNFFFHWVNLYWVAGHGKIMEDRRLSKSLWENFEYLYKIVCDLERKADPNSGDLRLANEPKRIEELLRAEIEDE